MSLRPLAVLALALSSCSTQYVDPVLAANTDGSDPCAAWHTESDCANDTAHVCSVQPNELGCHLNDSDCAPWQCASGYPFVRRVGTSLRLRDQPFRFVGANAWGVAWGNCSYSAFPSQDAALAQTFGDLSDMRVQALRIWAFQSYAGSDGKDYSSLDAVVRYARAAGVRLILVLENMRDDCSKGTRDDSWFQSGYEQPYGGYALSLPDYARGLITHFLNEPTVLGWEIMHEAGGNDAAAMLAFFTRMSTLVDDTDGNHLIILGTNNGDTPATSIEGNPAPFATLHGLEPVDLVDAHEFGSPDTPVSASEQNVVNIAQSLGKASFVGASAVSMGNTSAAAFSQRASRVSAKIDGALNAGFIGFLQYAYTPGWQDPGFDFDGRSGEPLAGPQGVLASFADRVRAP